MRKADRARLALAAVLLSLPLLSLGQVEGTDAKGTPEGPFAAIDASLLTAADAAIGDPTVRRPENRIERPPLATADSVSPATGDQAPSGRTSPAGLNALVRPILTREGVPDQLAAVIQVESGGNPRALSPKGARGLWQLMPDTARRYGLKVDHQMDERINLEKSTESAARYLRDLCAQFGSWPLALAAYNTGEQNLERAMDRARSRDFATLSARGYLPLETRKYVPAVLAAMGRLSPSAAAPALHLPSVSVVYARLEESIQ